MSRLQSSKISQFKPRLKPQLPTQVIKQRKAVRRLVESDDWETLLDEMAMFLESHRAPLPKDEGGFRGFSTYSILKEGLEQFVASLEATAEAAPAPEDEEDLIDDD